MQLFQIWVNSRLSQIALYNRDLSITTDQRIQDEPCMAYRPTAKTEARKQAQLQLLIESSLQIVAYGGFSALTMNALAKQADLGTGTVYRYFDNKAHLCTEVFRIATEKELEFILNTAFPGLAGSCLQRLSDVILSFSHRAIAGRRLAYALIAEPVDADIDQQRLEYRQTYAQIFQRLIDEGIAQNEFIAQNSALTAAAIVGILSEALLTPLGLAVNDAVSFAHDEFINELEQVCLRAVGIQTPAAHTRTREPHHDLSNA